MPGRECQCCGHFDAELCLALMSGSMPHLGPGDEAFSNQVTSRVPRGGAGRGWMPP